MKMKVILQVLGLSVLAGVVIDVTGFLGISFVLWEWVEIDWVVARGVIALCVLIMAFVVGLTITEEGDKK